MLSNRDAVQKALQEAGIASAVYYPIPLHQQEVYNADCAGLSLPVTEQAAKMVLSLPIFPELTREQVEQICAVVLQAV